MIYWHVERNSLCMHSQLKSPSSSEVASMIEGVIHHCTEMEVDRQYVDSHGQSTVAFAFCRLLGFQLPPRLKATHSQTMYRPEAGKAGAYANLQLILGKPIDWELIPTVRSDDQVRHGATPGDRRNGSHFAPLHQAQRSASHLQGLRRTGKGHQPNWERPSRRSSFAGICTRKRCAVRSTKV
jgi:hypothetical protein